MFGSINGTFYLDAIIHALIDGKFRVAMVVVGVQNSGYCWRSQGISSGEANRMCSVEVQK